MFEGDLPGKRSDPSSKTTDHAPVRDVFPFVLTPIPFIVPAQTNITTKPLMTMARNVILL